MYCLKIKSRQPELVEGGLVRYDGFDIPIVIGTAWQSYLIMILLAPPALQTHRTYKAHTWTAQSGCLQQGRMIVWLLA